MTRSEAAAYLLQAEYTPSWVALEKLLLDVGSYRYSFLDSEEFVPILNKNTARGMEIYWKEILCRAHWAAMTSLIRTHRWSAGVFDGFASENLIVFCACTRGLLESSADCWDSLSVVAPTLASAKETIELAISNHLNERRVAEDLESRLMHFTFARKRRKGEALPESHSAKTVADYLRHFEREQPSIMKFYTMLCDVVHPGASSVLSFSRSIDNGNKIELSFEVERRSLAEFAVCLRLVLTDIIAASFNTGILILRTLNYLPLKPVHTPLIDSLPFKPIPAWKSIESLLEK